MSWDLRSDSPLLDVLASGTERARFTLDGGATPTRSGPSADTGSSGPSGAATGQLLAGACEVDLTPPPGMPKAGYSSNAVDGAGFRSRLRARVLHLHQDGTSLAIVQCDLLGGSAVLAHLVARHVAERTDVPLAGLMIGATHTHAGPGQFLGTDFYNRFASNRSGFDPAWTQFLAERIAGAVTTAVETRRPARAAVGTTDVWGWTRNRSLPPFVRNPEVDDKRTGPQRKWVSVDPRLHLVRVDVDAPDGGSEPLAAMVVFGVHGTGISMHEAGYNADLWGYLVGELSHRIELASGRRAVVGAIEGTHADVAPAIRPGQAGHLEAQRVGRGIGEAAAGLWAQLEGELTGTLELGAGLHEVDLDAGRSAGGVTLPRRPAVGAALVAGAHENTTPVIHRLPPFRAGSPKPWATRHPQGPKWVIGTRWLQPLVLPTRGFPRVLPVQVLRLGGTALVGLPFEVTVAAGVRLADAVADATAAAGIDRVVVSSVANEYSGYVSTPEEYALQFYEGGHTLYGPGTQPFLAAHAADLAARVMAAGGRPVLVGGRRGVDLKVRRYLPESFDADVAAPRRWEAQAAFADPDDRTDATWSQTWIDVAPGGLRWHEPLVSVETLTRTGDWSPAHTRDGRRADDQAWDLEVRHLGPVRGAEGAARGGQAALHRYEVRWHDPVLVARRAHGFVLPTNGGRPAIVSAPFD
jgi:neutral ceramidase